MHLGVCLAPSFWLPWCVRCWSPVPKSVLHNARKDLGRDHPLKWPRTCMHIFSKATHQRTPLVQLQTPLLATQASTHEDWPSRSAFPQTCAQKLHAYRVSCNSRAQPLRENPAFYGPQRSMIRGRPSPLTVETAVETPAHGHRQRASGAAAPHAIYATCVVNHGAVRAVLRTSTEGYPTRVQLWIRFQLPGNPDANGSLVPLGLLGPAPPGRVS